MENVFFHPKMVHLPMALAVVLPLVSVVVLFAWRRGVFQKSTCAIVVLLQGLLVVGAVSAVRSGEAEEERVEDIVGESLVESHEDAAKAFTGASVIVFLVMAAALFLNSERRSQGLALLSCLGTLAVLGLGIRAGQRGGELVYKHGAASAYTQPDKEGPVPKSNEHDDD